MLSSQVRLERMRAFLLPAETFAADVRTPVTLDSLLLLKQRWGVSVAAMIMRLEALKILDADAKLVLFKRRSARWGLNPSQVMMRAP